jgi:adenylate cyclase
MKIGRQWGRRIGVAAVLALVLGALAPQSPHLERLGVDVLIALRHLTPLRTLFPPSQSDVVVIAVDEQTYKTEPFNNTPKVMWTKHWAKILNVLDEVDPKVIGFDIIYPTTVDRPDLLPGYDRNFLLALRRAATKDRIVLGMALLGGEPVRPYMAHVIAAGREKNLRYLNFEIDPADDVVRGYFKGFRQEDGTMMPSFGVELAKRAGAAEPLEDEFLINFNTTPGAIPVYSMADIWQCADAGKLDYFRQHFAGKIVLIGEALDIEDRKVTARRWAMTNGEDVAAAPSRCIVPADPRFTDYDLNRRSRPGVLIHAAAINTMTKNLYLTRATKSQGFAMVAASVFLLSLVFFVLKPVAGIVAAFVVVAGQTALSVLAFAGSSVLLVVAFALTAALAYALVYAYRFMVEDKERR